MFFYLVVSEEEGVACLVMQYASGGDLLERIVSTGPLTERVCFIIHESSFCVCII